MTLRSRLAWAFSAMLLVPLSMLLLVGALVRWWWDPSSDNERWSVKNQFRALAVLNEELDNPEGLVAGAGFERLAATLPPGISLGSWTDGQWIQTSPGFLDVDRGRGHGGSRTLFVWNLSIPAKQARLEVRWSPRVALGVWGGWAMAGFLGFLSLLVATNGVLTWLVSRSVIRPLRTLEAAAKRLGEGDLEPGPLPSSPPEFQRVGLAFDDLRRRLKDSLAERQALEEERRTWVAAVSHDLRTPLAVIRGYAEGLRDGVASSPEKQVRYQGVILDRARQMERQVDDLFHWARWDWGHPQFRLQRLDLVEELKAAVAAWSADWSDLGLQWSPPTGSWPVLADPIALRRIFDNLARNCVQHTGPHPVLHLSLEAQETFWVVSFRDEGPGLAPEVLPRVFERFFRGDPARNPGQGGGGLGLTIARTLAEGQGGTMAAANHPEGGAVFALRLPRPTEDPI